MKNNKEFGVIQQIGDKLICKMNYNPIHYTENILPVIKRVDIKDYNSYTTSSRKGLISTRFECICTSNQLKALQRATIQKNIVALQQKLTWLI